ncbi:transglutaminase-like domain-containing protein [Lentisphaerota bacterium WC36G]|nr:transglutaminase-like domain-containing protein [Lentisphaerae bacterium WC36]
MKRKKKNNDLRESLLNNSQWEKVGFKLKINTYIFLMVIALFYVLLTKNYFLLLTLTICAITTLFFKKNVKVSLKSILYITVLPLLTTAILYKSTEFHPLIFDFTRLVFRHNIYIPFILMISMLMTIFYRNNKNIVIICVGPLLCLAMCSDWSSTMDRESLLAKFNENMRLEIVFYAVVIISFSLLIKIVYTYYHPERIRLFTRKTMIQFITILTSFFIAFGLLIAYEENRLRINYALRHVVSALTRLDNYILYGNRKVQGIRNQISLNGSSKEFMGNDDSIIMRVSNVESEEEKDAVKKLNNEINFSYLRGNSYSNFDSATWTSGTFKTNKPSSAQSDSNVTTFYLNRKQIGTLGTQFKIFLETSVDNKIYFPGNCFQIKTVADDLEIDYGGNAILKGWSTSSDYDVFVPVNYNQETGFNNHLDETNDEILTQYLMLTNRYRASLKRFLEPNNKKFKKLKQLSFKQKLHFVNQKFANFTYSLNFYRNLTLFKIKLRDKVRKDKEFRKTILKQAFELQKRVRSQNTLNLNQALKNATTKANRKIVEDFIKESNKQKNDFKKFKRSRRALQKYIENYSPLDYFMFEAKDGHCEMFATATALCLRLLNVPTRYITGYMCEEKTPFGYYVVRQRNAHAWVEAYDYETKTWYKVENTPDATNAFGSKKENKWGKFASLKEQMTMFFKRMIASFKKGNFSTFMGATIDKVIAFLKEFFTNARSLISFIIVVILIGLFILFKIKGFAWLFKSQKKSDYESIYKSLQNIESEIVKITNQPRKKSESFKIYFERISLNKQLKEMLSKWCKSFYLIRYSRDKVENLNEEDLKALQQELTFITKQLKKNVKKKP